MLTGAFLAFGASLAVQNAYAITAFQEKSYNFTVPNTPLASFDVSYVGVDDALSSLADALGANATVEYPGAVAYGSTQARVWAKQCKPYPDAIAYPQTPEDVSIIMQFYHSNHYLWGTEGFSVMCGGHAQMGGAQTSSVIIDMQYLNTVEVIEPTEDGEYAILKIGGGSKGGHVYDALDGTGWAFLGPRAVTIGAGGFLLGGGIAYQTGRYGTGVDNIVGLEIVLVNGTIVYANPENDYSDLFWACTGGGWLGFGVVSHYYVRANPNPGDVTVGTFYFGQDNVEPAWELATEFYETNTDPDAFPAMVYGFKSVSNPTGVVPITERQLTAQWNALYFGSEAKFNESYAGWYDIADTVSIVSYSLKTLQQYLAVNYPYGYRRTFFGKSHTNATVDFWSTTFGIWNETINGMLAAGEDPGNSLWVSEYMFPGWNGAGPIVDSDTAWPHATSAHVSLIALQYVNETLDSFIEEQDTKMEGYLRDFQASLDMPPIYDYPNYISPWSVTSEVWGEDNFNRLIAIKEVYDPDCLFNRGRVIPTTACTKKGLANTFL
ncbi:FAD-binding domain-containing protein [Mucidula mucida]|nr:FAD-binding domain-containing protein [Mucidula mucida]